MSKFRAPRVLALSLSLFFLFSVGCADDDPVSPPAPPEVVDTVDFGDLRDDGIALFDHLASEGVDLRDPDAVRASAVRFLERRFETTPGEREAALAALDAYDGGTPILEWDEFPILQEAKLAFDAFLVDATTTEEIRGWIVRQRLELQSSNHTATDRAMVETWLDLTERALDLVVDAEAQLGRRAFDLKKCLLGILGGGIAGGLGGAASGAVVGAVGGPVGAGVGIGAGGVLGVLGGAATGAATFCF